MPSCSVSIPIPIRSDFDLAVALDAGCPLHEVAWQAERQARNMRAKGLGLGHVGAAEVRIGSGRRSDPLAPSDVAEAVHRGIARAARPEWPVGRVVVDSHGGMWEVCRPMDEDAVAFGPTGAARPVTVEGIGHAPTLDTDRYDLREDPDGWTTVIRDDG